MDIIIGIIGILLLIAFLGWLIRFIKNKVLGKNLFQHFTEIKAELKYTLSGGRRINKQIEKFENAENNDYVLAYKDADISIIYRKGENRIIKIDNYSNFVAAANPINISLLAADTAQKSIQDKISQQFKNAVVSNKSTPKTAQTKGVVYATSPDFNDAAKQLAQLLGYDVGSLPAGEDAPAQGTDIVIVAPVANQ